MEKIGRRSFCGTVAMAIPFVCLNAKFGEKSSGQSDAVIDSLADEISQITKDGIQHGFKGEHLRRYAGVVRTFDACLEEKGSNQDFDNRLDMDDYSQLNPAYTARITTQYWQKRAINFDEDELTAQLAITPEEYQEMKKAIKKRGGIRHYTGRSPIFSSAKQKNMMRTRTKTELILKKAPSDFHFGPNRHDQISYKSRIFPIHRS